MRQWKKNLQKQGFIWSKAFLSHGSFIDKNGISIILLDGKDEYEIAYVKNKRIIELYCESTKELNKNINKIRKILCQ